MGLLYLYCCSDAVMSSDGSLGVARPPQRPLTCAKTPNLATKARADAHPPAQVMLAGTCLMTSATTLSRVHAVLAWILLHPCACCSMATCWQGFTTISE